jgi:hypothetical protein
VTKEQHLMDIRQFLKTTVVSLLFLGLVVVGADSALSGNMFREQAIFLAHIPLGGGQFFTTNYVFTATEGAGSINLKCFNDQFQRIGPLLGVNVSLAATGQMAQHTPTTLAVTTDPLFASGVGWCFADTVVGSNDFNSQITVGVTSDLTVGGILNSASSSFIGHNTGLGETSRLNGGTPFFTSAGGAQHFLVLVNPYTTTTTLSLQLFDTSGNQQGPTLSRTLNGRALLAVSVPAAWGLTTPPTTGNVRIQGASIVGQGYLGWSIQAYPNGRVIFNAVGLDGDTIDQIPPAAAP